jgi:molecular chaperone GrpE (heat shock protein)
MMTNEDIIELEKQLENLRNKENIEDRGPNDLTRRIDELEKENSMLKEKIKRLQTIMMEQYRNAGAV